MFCIPHFSIKRVCVKIPHDNGLIKHSNGIERGSKTRCPIKSVIRVILGCTTDCVYTEHVNRSDSREERRHSDHLLLDVIPFSGTLYASARDDRQMPVVATALHPVQEGDTGRKSHGGNRSIVNGVRQFLEGGDGGGLLRHISQRTP